MNLNLARQPLSNRPAPALPTQEERLIVDARAGLTPSQLVERKLIGVLRGGPMPVSQLLNAAKNRGPA